MHSSLGGTTECSTEYNSLADNELQNPLSDDAISNWLTDGEVQIITDVPALEADLVLKLVDMEGLEHCCLCPQ